VSWINKKSGPAFHTIATEDELMKFQETHSVFTLGAFGAADSAGAVAFQAMANDDELHTFAFTTDAAVLAKLGVAADSLVVLKTFDDLRADMSVASGFDAEAVGEWVMGNSMPLIQTFSAETSKQIFGSPITKHALFFTKAGETHHTEVMATMASVAASYKGKVLFVNVPHSENKVMEFFGLTAADIPRVVFADLNPAGGQMKKFMYEGDLTAGAVTDYVNEFLDGKLKAALKSEAPVPADTAGPVTILRGESFNDIVMNNDKDVFVEFYAPWCGHCKKLTPIWDELGEKFAANDNVVIAKMDSTANEIDVEGVAVKGFPTLFWFKGDDKAHPVAYQGARELDDLEAYVNANSKHAAAHSEL
jgi:protein disulfide-isomerase A1